MPLIETITVRQYDATGDGIGYEFIDIDVSILVDGVPYERPADEPVCYCRRCYLHDDPAGCVR